MRRARTNPPTYSRWSFSCRVRTQTQKSPRVTCSRAWRNRTGTSQGHHQEIAFRLPKTPFCLSGPEGWCFITLAIFTDPNPYGDSVVNGNASTCHLRTGNLAKAPFAPLISYCFPALRVLDMLPGPHSEGWITLDRSQARRTKYLVPVYALL